MIPEPLSAMIMETLSGFCLTLIWRIDGDNRIRPAVVLCVADEGAAADGAGAERDGDARFGHGRPGFLQGQLHAFGHGAGDEHAVGMTGQIGRAHV